MKKHILMLTGDWAIAYGKQNVFYEMLRGFSKHWDRISVICPSNEKGEVINIHGNVYLYPSASSKFLHLDFFKQKSFIIQKAQEIHKEHPFDIISAHVIPPLFANVKAAMSLSGKLNVPYVAEIMHIPGYPKANNFMERIEKVALDHFIKKNRSKIPYVRVINRSDTCDYVVNALGVPSSKILYIPAFYLDFNLFGIDKSVKRDPKKFVFCGRLEQNKGLDLLADAMSIAMSKDPKITLKVIGEGSMKGWLENRVKELGLEKSIDVAGWLPTREDVAKAYQESAAIVMTSYNEGGPRVTLEAMACSAICISTPVGVMKDFGKDKENLLFIDWDAEDIAEKILYVSSHPDEASRIAHEGLKSMQQFEYDKALSFYAEKYLEITDDR